MKLKLSSIFYRPCIAVVGVLLLCTSLAGLFHQKTEQHDVYTKYTPPNSNMILHGIAVNVPVSKRSDGKMTLNLKVVNKAWKIILVSYPDGHNEFAIIADNKTLMRQKCSGVPFGDYNVFRLRLYDGMIIWESADSITPIPTKNFFINNIPLEIGGVCSVEHSSSYKKVIWFSYFILALSIILLVWSTAPPFVPQLPDNKKLLYIGYACIIGELVACAFCCFHILNGRDFYPYNTFLFRPMSIGDDLFSTLQPIRHIFRPYGWVGAGNYFPFTYSFFALFPLKNIHAVGGIIYALFAFFSAFFALKTVRVKNSLECLLLLFITWFSLPTLLLWRSGNIEMLVFVIVAFTIFLLRRYPAVSAFLLAFVINIKLYPGALGVLFLKKKYYKYAFLCFVFSLIILLAALASQNWNIASPLACFKRFSDFYTLFVCDGLIFTHFLFSIYRYIVCNFFEWSIADIMAAQPYYYIICLIFFVAVVWNAVRKRYHFWEVTFLLLGSSVLLPPVSFDYTLVLLFPSLWFFLKKRIYSKYDNFYMLGWVLLFIPENWIHSDLYPELQISVLIKSVTLTAMMLAIMFSGKAKHKKCVSDDTNSAA